MFSPLRRYVLASAMEEEKAAANLQAIQRGQKGKERKSEK